MSKWQTWIVALGLVVLLAGCGASWAGGTGVVPATVAVPDGQRAVPSPTLTVTVPASPSRPMPLAAPLVASEQAEAQVDRARQDLARRLRVAPEQVVVAQVEAWTWPDAALGCPDAKRIYPPRDTPGYRIVLEAGERQYAYHTDEGERVVYCPGK